MRIAKGAEKAVIVSYRGVDHIGGMAFTFYEVELLKGLPIAKETYRVCDSVTIDFEEGRLEFEDDEGGIIEGVEFSLTLRK